MKNNTITNEKVNDLTRTVIEGVKNIRSTEEWAKMLSFQKGFWKYSFHNRLLIWLQKPNASKVAGYKTWQKKGYNVLKGEKGLKILAPILVKKTDKKTGEEERVIVGYKTVPVFDVSQTTCGSVPTAWKQTEAESEKAQALSEKIKSLPFVSATDEEARESGSYNSSTGNIEVKFSESSNQFVGTFIHEYCHKLIHEDLKEVEALRNLDYAKEEIVVESSAYILCSLAGIELETSSFGYVACWLLNAKKEDKEIENALSEIEKVVNTAAKSLQANGIQLLEETEEEAEA